MEILMTLSNPFTHDIRVYNEAKSLVKAGHKVTILGWDRLKNNQQTEIIEDIKVVRSYNTRFMNILPKDIFKLHLWWKKAYKDALGLYKKNPFDVIHCHNLDTLPTAVKLKKKLEIPIVYDAHEIWGYMVASDLPKIWANYYLWKEKHLIKYVDKIITVNEAVEKYFNKICNKQITLVLNCKNLIQTKYEPANNQIFTLLYIGSLANKRLKLEFIEAMKDISDIHCIIAGIGKPGFVKSLEETCSKIPNVDFIGKVPMNDVVPMTKKADVVICIFDPDNKNNKVGLPNKLFEAMVCGRPLISSKGTYLGEFTEKEKCGVVIEYSKDDFKRAIIELRDNPDLCERLGKTALELAISKYNWDKQEEKLVEIYEKIKG